MDQIIYKLNVPNKDACRFQDYMSQCAVVQLGVRVFSHSEWSETVRLLGRDGTRRSPTSQLGCVVPWGCCRLGATGGAPCHPFNSESRGNGTGKAAAGFLYSLCVSTPSVFSHILSTAWLKIHRTLPLSDCWSLQYADTVETLLDAPIWIFSQHWHLPKLFYLLWAGWLICALYFHCCCCEFLASGRARVCFPMMSLEFSIYLIFPTALWPWGRFSL